MTQERANSLQIFGGGHWNLMGYLPSLHAQGWHEANQTADRVPAQSSPLPVTAIILLVMGMAFLAGTLPARKASRQDPIDELRNE